MQAKSSALNAVVGRKGLARTSRTPGATRLINFFELTPGRRLVDLPGLRLRGGEGRSASALGCTGRVLLRLPRKPSRGSSSSWTCAAR